MAKIRVPQVFWEPIKNRLSPRSVLLEAVYLEALLYFKIQASVCEHLGKIPQYKCQAAEFSGYKSGSLACINEIDLCIQCSVSAPHYDQFGQIMSKN